MSELNQKKENEFETTAANKEKKLSTIHTIVSIIYIGMRALSSPLKILWSLVYGYGLLFAALWAIGSIIVSEKF